MYVKIVLASAVFCAVICQTNSEKSYDGRPFMQGYTRIKRGKYNSGPPRYYNRPPINQPIKGIYSHTPPPNYKADDDEPQYPGPPSLSRPKVSDDPYPGPPSHSRPKASRRPTSEGLGDDDINNIVKYLSKQDLDKIIDLAGGKNRDSGYSKDLFDKYTEFSNPPKRESDNSDLHDSDLNKHSPKPFSEDDGKLFKALVQEIDMDPKYSAPQQDAKPFSIEYSKPSKPSFNYVTQPTPPEAYFAEFQNNNNVYDTAALAAEESMLKRQIAYLQSQISDGVVYTDSKVMPEEHLPKPMNLREEPDFEVSYTNNVPTVVKAEQSSSYKLENFGDLPLMNYNSKLDTLSSYHVPHYTVTSSKSSAPPYSAPASFPPPSPYGVKAPPVEPAPPPSAAKSQSDAHLKAVRIWSHKSKGTAYTLHNDGSLSLEKPGRPKGSYGYP